MEVFVRSYEEKDLPEMIRIWNEVVKEGVAFPQEEFLDEETGRAFFAAQVYNGVAVDADTGEVLGLYILHPNNVGRCGHICNASYAVSAGKRGLHIGEKLVFGLSGAGEKAWVSRAAVQCRGGDQCPRAPSLRTAWLRPVGNDSGRVSHEGRAL